MSDGLPHLLPGDPKNLLSVEARKRIQRAIIEADKFIWEAEVLITNRHLDEGSHKARALRNTASFKKAKATLSVYRREFSRIEIPERKYREYMESEIEAASNSLELSGAQRQLLKTEFFFPEEKSVQPRSSTTPPSTDKELKPIQLPSSGETIAVQLQRLRDECRWTIEDLASATGISTRQVARHLSSEFNPLPRKISAYDARFRTLKAVQPLRNSPLFQSSSNTVLTRRFG